MRVVQVRAAARCAVCHDDLDLLAVACAGCASVGHVECWAELGRCSSLGCARSGARPGRVAVVAVERPPTPSVDWLWDARLIELVVVVAIVGLLAAVVAVNVMGQGCSRSPYRTIRRDMQAIGDALDLYKVDSGHYPDRLDALWEQPAGQRRWGPEPYLKEYPPKDPWGNEYQYVPPVGDRTFELVSYGADGAPGGVQETGDFSSRRFFDAELDGR